MFILLILTTLLVGSQQQSFAEPFSNYGYSSMFPSALSQMSSSSAQSFSPSYSMGGMNDVSLGRNPSGLQSYNYGMYPSAQSSYMSSTGGMPWTAQSNYVPTNYGMYPSAQSSYMSSAGGMPWTAQSNYVPNNYGMYPSAQSSYMSSAGGMPWTAQSNYVPNNYGMYPSAQSSYMSSTNGMPLTAQSSYIPNSYGKYSTGQSSYRPNNYGMYSNAENNYISKNNEIMNSMTSGYSSYYGSQSQTPYAHTHGPLASPNPYHHHHFPKYSYGSDDYNMQLNSQNYPTYFKSLTAYGNYYPSKYYSSYSSQKPSHYSNNSPANTHLHYSSGKSQYPSYSSYYFRSMPHAHVHFRPTHGYSKNDDYKSHSHGYNSYVPMKNYNSVNKYLDPSRNLYNTFPKNLGHHNYRVKNAHGILKKQQDDTEFDDSGIKFPHIHILSSGALFRLLHPQHGNGFSSIKRINDEDVAPKTKIMKLLIFPKSFKQEKSTKMFKNRFISEKVETEAKESDISDNEGNEEVDIDKEIAKPKDIANLIVKVTTTEPAQKSTEELVANLDQKLARDSSNEINMKDNMINRDILFVTRTDYKDETQSTPIDMQHHVSSNVQVPEKSENKETNDKDSSLKTPEEKPKSALNGLEAISISTETPKSTSASSPVTVIEH